MTLTGIDHLHAEIRDRAAAATLREDPDSSVVTSAEVTHRGTGGISVSGPDDRAHCLEEQGKR